MTQQIKTILTPVRVYSVEDFMRIAQVVTGNEHSANFEAINLIRRYEEITRGKLCDCRADTVCPSGKVGSQSRCFQPALLTKGHFVVPDTAEFTDQVHGEQDIKGYETAKKKVWFEGFEQHNVYDHRLVHQESMLIVSFYTSKIDVEQYGNVIIYHDGMTVFDFTNAIDRYNRTATTPIHITPTDSFVEALINDKN